MKALLAEWCPAVVLLAGCSVLLVFGLGDAHAITPTGFMPGVEQALAGAFNMSTGVIVPAMSWVALVSLVANLYFHFFKLGAKATGLLIGVFMLGAGLPWLSQISGGAIATSFTL